MNIDNKKIILIALAVVFVVIIAAVGINSMQNDSKYKPVETRPFDYNQVQTKDLNEIENGMAKNKAINSIKIISPTSNEVISSQTHTIKWESLDKGNSVDILVKQFDKDGKQLGDWSIISENVSNNLEYYEWRPYIDSVYSIIDHTPRKISTGIFKLKIVKTGDYTISDTKSFILNDELSASEDYCLSVTGGTVVYGDNSKYCIWTEKILENGCGGSYGEGSQYCDESDQATKILKIPSGFSDAELTNFKVDDNGKLSINNQMIYSTTGCAGDYSINKDITSFLHSGDNSITADVNNDCGLSMSASATIRFKLP